MTSSSPALIDLDRDGALDIVFGTGVDRLTPRDGGYAFADEPEISGTVVAISGARNEVLWQVPNPRDAFTTPRFLDVNGDGVPDVIMGGREGAFGAFDGRDGSVLWRVSPDAVAATPAPYNFTTPAIIRDADGDGVSDLVVAYGGDATKPPNAPRDAGYLAVVSGVDGSLLAVHAMPDGRETYASPVAYERADGRQWVIFGTGGETAPGAAYRVPVDALNGGGAVQPAVTDLSSEAGSAGSSAVAVQPERPIEPGTQGTIPAERLTEPGTKGAIAPATILELTGDGEPDIVVSTFDGRLVAVDGASGRALWQHSESDEESYHPAAVVRVARDGRLGLLVSRGVGVFPDYTGTVHRLHDARDGRVLYQYSDPFAPGGAPLAVDLTGDGIDELVFFSVRFPRAPGGRIHIFHGASGELIVHETPTTFGTTPVIADPRGAGTLELIGLSWSLEAVTDTVDWRNMRWQLLRLDLGVAPPPVRSWAGYMGTAADGWYRRAERN
jgi:outer membrane protein assembly factor BamB